MAGPPATNEGLAHANPRGHPITLLVAYTGLAIATLAVVMLLDWCSPPQNSVGAQAGRQAGEQPPGPGLWESHVVPGAAGAGWGPLESRHLTAASVAREEDSWVFSRPPYSKQEASAVVYLILAGIYAWCIVVVVVGYSFDARERRRRIGRAIVPQELVKLPMCCCTCLVPQHSLPSEISEQYYLDQRLLRLRAADEIGARRRQMNFWSYAHQYAAEFADTLSREHLALSILVCCIPTFTRLKRALLVILHLHICMLTGALVLNRREHERPGGTYQLLNCGSGSSDFMATNATDVATGPPDSLCMATAPPALLAAALLLPAFRLLLHRQLRLTCFVLQGHASTSQFPLDARKSFAVPKPSALDSLCCRRRGPQRRGHGAGQKGSLAHRAVKMLWMTTHSSINELRFYSSYASWCILVSMAALMAAAAAYVLAFTVYLEEAVVYHWLAWTLTMHFSSALLAEPMWIFLVEVLWRALVAEVAQQWGMGAAALSYTSRHMQLVRKVEASFIGKVREAGAVRIQRWWLAVLEMHRAIHEKTAAAIKIQSIRKCSQQVVKYAKARKWCLRVDVMDACELRLVAVHGQQSPMVRLRCDKGNPRVMQTKVCWNSGASASFHESFFVDVSESASLYVSAWSRDLEYEEFIGRGLFDFASLRTSRRGSVDEHILRVNLYAIEHGERLPSAGKPLGYVNVRVQFLDPFTDPCGADGQEEWMLPSSRVQFSLAKHGPSGRVKASRAMRSVTPANAEIALESAGVEMDVRVEPLALQLERSGAPKPEEPQQVQARLALLERPASSHSQSSGQEQEKDPAQTTSVDWRPDAQRGARSATPNGDDELRTRIGAGGQAPAPDVVIEEEVFQEDDFYLELHTGPFVAEWPPGQGLLAKPASASVSSTAQPVQQPDFGQPRPGPAGLQTEARVAAAAAPLRGGLGTAWGSPPAASRPPSLLAPLGPFPWQAEEGGQHPASGGLQDLGLHDLGLQDQSVDDFGLQPDLQPISSLNFAASSPPADVPGVVTSPRQGAVPD